jgi:hypothetical protein
VTFGDAVPSGAFGALLKFVLCDHEQWRGRDDNIEGTGNPGALSTKTNDGCGGEAHHNRWLHSSGRRRRRSGSSLRCCGRRSV